jgi:hypothetical protein
MPRARVRGSFLAGLGSECKLQPKNHTVKVQVVRSLSTKRTLLRRTTWVVSFQGTWRAATLIDAAEQNTMGVVHVVCYLRVKRTRFRCVDHV